MDYKELLEKARKELPESLTSKERFEIPKVLGRIQGNRTIVSNFTQIAKTFNRDQDHLLKYILKETATPGKLDGQRLILGSKVSATMLNQKIKQYASVYVLCPDCGKPDTQLVKEKGISMLKCTACGSKHTVRLI